MMNCPELWNVMRITVSYFQRINHHARELLNEGDRKQQFSFCFLPSHQHLAWHFATSVFTPPREQIAIFSELPFGAHLLLSLSAGISIK
jgi:hypothetical protein